jgi:hypothetical protein
MEAQIPLAGAQFSGLVIRMYSYPQKVAGLIFVAGTKPREIDSINEVVL